MTTESEGGEGPFDGRPTVCCPKVLDKLRDFLYTASLPDPSYYYIDDDLADRDEVDPTGRH